MRNHFSLFIIITICFPISLFSQQKNFLTYTAKDGLPVSTIFAIAQDSRNYLWIGTEGGGASRFDGSEFRTFTRKDGLAGNQVRCIMEDTKGNLWFGTDNGISIYNGHEFRTIRDELHISGSTVIDLMEDRKNNIWAATDKNGLRKITFLENDSIIIEQYTKEQGLTGNFVFDIHEDNSGRLWLALAGGLDVMIPEEDSYSIQNLGRRLSISGKITTSITQDSKGLLWVSTRNSGVIRLEAHQQLDSINSRVYDISTGLNDNHVWNILEDQYGQIWIATDEGGINLMSQDGIRILTKEQGLPSNQIYRLFQDREKNIWIGTYGSGLSKFLGNHFSHFDIDEQHGPYHISDVVHDSENKLWLGTFGDGLIRMTKGEKPVYEYFTKADGLAENSITSIAIDHKGDIWISYPKTGIGRISPRGIDHYTEEDGMIISNSVNCLLFDTNNNLWCGTNGGITIYIDDVPYTDFDQSMGLTSNKVQTLMEDSFGNIWIGTKNGLMKASLPEFTSYDEEEGLYDLMINSLEEDHKGNIWIGTFGGGIYKFDRTYPDSLPIMLVARDDILSSNNIFSLAFQNDSILISGTEKGFDKILLDEQQEVISVKSYDESNGFFGIENNLNAIDRDTEGNFWFGTANGLTRYNPQLEYINQNAPRTYITNIRIRYEEQDWSTASFGIIPWFNMPVNPVLKWSDNHITFRYTGVSLSNPEKIRYRYKLEGLDRDWAPSTTTNEVIYQNLEPGQYEFQVIAGNENGIWIKDPTSFKFTITPPVWAQWWFYALIILILLSATILLIRYREKQLIRKNRELESKVRERTKEISEQKEEIEAQRDEIENQRDEIEVQRDLVISQKQEITDSIYYAQRIQKAVLPHESYMEKVMPEHFIIYKPRNIVSGDFYWVKSIGTRLIIIAADCTGHGVPGAFMSMLGIALLNEHIDNSNFDDPGEILNQLRGKIKDIMTQEGKMEEQKDGMDMAITIYNQENRGLQYSGAYNPLYLIRRKEKSSGHATDASSSIDVGEFVLHELKADRQPIGIHSIEKDFTTHSLSLEEKDTFYIFSDGFVDQFGGEDRKKFKTVNFKKLLLSIQDKDLDQQKEVIEQTFESWRGDFDQIDDILIVGVKV